MSLFCTCIDPVFGGEVILLCACIDPVFFREPPGSFLASGEGMGTFSWYSREHPVPRTTFTPTLG